MNRLQAFGNRLWGVSIGWLTASIFIDKPQWVTVLIIIVFAYFLIFGDTHFRGKK